jgi:acetyl esterase
MDMTDMGMPEAEWITCGRDLPLAERFCYRALKSFVYKTTPQANLSLHVHYPHDWRPADRRPSIVFFFGGGLQDGTVEQFTRQAVYLAGRGMVVARADYRVMPKHSVTADACVADAKSAVRWVRAHAGELGIDPAKIAAGGGSSGGFLAAATGILPEFDEAEEDPTVSSRPSLMVLFNPAFDIHSRTTLIVDDIPGHLRELLPKCLAPTEELGRTLHIASHLTAEAPPMWVWYGTADPIYRFAHGFLTRARELACRMDLLLTEGADHGDFNDYMPPYRKTLAGMTTFLEHAGYLE